MRNTTAAAISWPAGQVHKNCQDRYEKNDTQHGLFPLQLECVSFSHALSFDKDAFLNLVVISPCHDRGEITANDVLGHPALAGNKKVI